MNRDELSALVLNAIGQVQSSSGRQDVPVFVDTVLTRDLDSFDSLNAVEVSATVSDTLRRIGIDLDVPVDIFLTDGKHQASFGYVVDAIWRLLEEK